jgi:hypothetical protein
MKVNIEFKDVNAVENLIRQKGETAKQIIVKRLMRIGEECVNVARNLPSPDANASFKFVKGKRKPLIKKYNPHQPNYIDWTGNLRHSIGYLVAVDGEIINADLQNSEATETAQKALSKYKDGIVLIMVAGMKYAYYVSKKGYDVLDSAIIEMKKKFEELVKFVNNV